MQDETKLLIWCRYLSPSSSKVRQCHLNEFQLSPFLVINNITVPLQKGIRWSGWLTAKKTSFMNTSITSFNYIIDKSILDSEGNVCGIITITIIEITFDNQYIHVLNYLPKRYIYIYLISTLISSVATIQNIIWQTICLLLIWGDVKYRKGKKETI